MRWTALRGFVLVVAVAMIGGPAARAEITAKQAQEAISGGCDFLKRQQNPDTGGWPEHSNFPYGVSGLCTLALLSCGLPVDDPNVAKALEYLRSKRPEKTYSLALQTMVLCAATPVRDRALIEHNVKLLQSKQIKGTANTGAWNYPDIGNGDNSNAQFALLALHEADLAGVKVDPQVWRLAKKYWEDCQNPDGSWGYQRGERDSGTGSMTCAGISSMIIAGGHVGLGDAQANGDQVQCCGQQDQSDSVERGIEWLAKHFSVSVNPSGGGGIRWRLYYLYALERVGRMSARRFIGQHDWYREGADVLINAQDNIDHYWKGQESIGAGDDRIVSTSFALLFLAKGRRPVLASKLKYGDGPDWNHHRADLGNLTTYVEAKWRKPLTWQVLDFNRAKIDDLVQTPVLFITGSQAIRFSDDQVKLLRDYVDRGGFIFAEATCPQCKDFHDSFVKLMERVFPEPEYQLKLLAPEHPIWHAEERIPPDLQRPLLGVEYGCRTCVAYSPPPRPEDPPGNLSCYWELWRLGRDQKYSPKVTREINAANSIGINVMAYATNREPRNKDEIPSVVDTKRVTDKVERGKLYVANLRHPGGCDVAPAAIPNLLRTAEQQLKIRVGIKTELVPINDEQLFDYPLLFMHGRNSFRLSDTERKLLKQYVLERDGTIFADAICANKAFAAAFRAEMQVIFPEHPLQPIPANHALWTDKFGGYDLSKVRRRELAGGNPQGPIQNKFREGPPELEGIKNGDRYAVIFSPYDLSCALEKRQSLECEGYVTEDAERIGLNVILYFLQGGEAGK